MRRSERTLNGYRTSPSFGRQGKSSRKLVNDFHRPAFGEDSLSREEQEELISHNLDRLFDLQKYPFTALEIAPTVDEEQVADIFVRINSEGVKLNQADFVLTLLSVFWDEGRHALERFCRDSRKPASGGSGPSPFNHFIQPDPDQLLRVSVALGFNRGRLKSVYQVLRGKSVDSGEYSPERREEQFDILKEAQAHVLNLTNWHQFLNALVGAGFRSAEMISSQSALMYSYAFYLIGRIQFKVPEHALQKAIGRWFFASSLTGRYTGSPESAMDSDLNRIKVVNDAKAFVSGARRCDRQRTDQRLLEDHPARESRELLGEKSRIICVRGRPEPSRWPRSCFRPRRSRS